MLRRALDPTLTDRQELVVQSAYHAGYFDWPREATGEETADSPGIAAPTFHQHLRKVEARLFEALLSTSPVTT